VVLVVSLILGKIVDVLVGRTAKFFAIRTSAIDERVIRSVRKPLFISIVIAGAGIALRLQNLPDLPGLIVGGTLKTLLVLVWFFFGIRTLEFLLRWMAANPNRFRVVQPSTLPMFEISTKVFFTGLAIYILILAWKANPTAWLTSAGIIGIAIGFAAKDTLANLFAGVSILADAPYKVGDWIVLDGDRGQVIKIGLRSTRLLTRDDVEITIPNSTIANAKIINESGGPSVKHRLRVPVGVAYGSDIHQVRRVLESVAMANQNVCTEPKPRVRFRSFGDSSLNFEILCWIENPMARGLTVDSLNTEIYDSLTAAKIEIPFPKRDVYIRQMPQVAPERRPEAEQKAAPAKPHRFHVPPDQR
jgi:small-conductance mechanosensitive channel